MQKRIALSLVLLSACAHQTTSPSPYPISNASYERFALQNPPQIGNTPVGQPIFLGGFSGLYFIGRNESNGNLQFLTHTDRGPNTEPMPGSAPIRPRPFLFADYNPHWITLELEQNSKQLKIVDRKPLKRKSGKLLSGLPNRVGDEEPVNTKGQKISYDPFGEDIESVTILPNGEIWMTDEYRPSVLIFTADGVLRDRLIPKNVNSKRNEFGSETLPAIYSTRQTNRGFEALANQNGSVFAFMQSPLEKKSLKVPVAEIDIKSREFKHEYFYPIDTLKSDKIGDAVSVGDGEFLIIERDGDIGANTKKLLYFAKLDPSNNSFKKRLVLDLTKTGFHDIEKAEGLAVVDEYTVALVNDNDFGLAGPFDLKTGEVKIKTEPSYLLLVHIPEGIHAFSPDNR